MKTWTFPASCAAIPRAEGGSSGRIPTAYRGTACRAPIGVSTTAAFILMNFGFASGSDTAWLWPDDAASSGTRPGPTPLSGRASRGAARASAVPPVPSTATVPPSEAGLPLFCPSLSTRHRQEGVREQRQGDVPVPAYPPAHLVLVQPHFPFGLFKGLLNSPTHPSYPYQLFKRGVLWAKAHIVGQFLGLGDVAPGQQPVPFVRLG